MNFDQLVFQLNAIVKRTYDLSVKMPIHYLAVEVAKNGLTSEKEMEKLKKKLFEFRRISIDEDVRVTVNSILEDLIKNGITPD